MKETPETPANKSNTQTVNIVMNNSITVQIMGESSRSSELDQVLTNFKAKPYSDNAHIVISQQE